jgi:hypothetical protein
MSTMLLSANAQVILFDQTSGLTTTGVPAQNFEPVNNIYDCEVADDFVVPVGETWYLDSFRFFGFHGGGVGATILPTAGFNFKLHNDNAGLPGTVIYSDSIIVNADPDENGSIVATFASPITLTAGTYWFSGQANKEFGTTGQWYARLDSVGAGSPAKWQNPGAGFALGCTSWSNLGTCFTGVPSGYTDAVFRVYGCYGPTKPNLIELSDTAVCGPQSMTFTTGSTDPNIAYAWNTGATNQSITTDSSGLYWVVVYDTITECGLRTSAKYTINSIPTANLVDDTICDGLVYQFNGTGCATCTSVWHDGSTGPFYSTGQAGQVSVTITNNNTGCVGSDTAELSIHVVEIDILPGNPAYLCEDGELTLKTVQDFVTYQWWNGTDPASFMDSITTESSLPMRLEVEDSVGCTGYDTVLIINQPNPVPVIQKQLLSNGKVKLSTSNPHTSYYWSTFDTTETITVSVNGLYNITVTDEYGCEGETFASVVNIGIDEAIAAQLKIYPNPASDYLNINWPATWVGEANSVLYDQAGKVVMSFSVDQQRQLIDLSTLPAGSYILTTDSPDGMAKSTIIIQ